MVASREQAPDLPLGHQFSASFTLCSVCLPVQTPKLLCQFIWPPKKLPCDQFSQIRTTVIFPLIIAAFLWRHIFNSHHGLQFLLFVRIVWSLFQCFLSCLEFLKTYLKQFNISCSILHQFLHTELLRDTGYARYCNYKLLIDKTRFSNYLLDSKDNKYTMVCFDGNKSFLCLSLFWEKLFGLGKFSNRFCSTIKAGNNLNIR